MGIIHMKKSAHTYCNLFLQIFPSSFPIINCRGKKPVHTCNNCFKFILSLPF